MDPLLALSNAGAVHPVRRAFPPPAIARPPRARRPGDDLRLFLMTFAAGFVAFSALIA